MVVGGVHVTKNYYRYRQREPSEFKKDSYRTYTVTPTPTGRTRKIITGELKKGGRAIQSKIVSRT